ncbi:MAG TPA: hypothetical protein VJL89_11555 [Thermodesulfovibrionia bacterium]|nr:hypothetical protein [Thermodesulfovibrionia bacterium]
MNILLVSADNSKEIKRGGKHIHQELLERGWLKLGHNVDTVYPETKKNPFLKLFWVLVSKINKGLRFRLETGNLIKRLSQKIELLIINGKYDAISAQDVLAVNAVKKTLMKSHKSILAVVTLHGYLHRSQLIMESMMKKENRSFMTLDTGRRGMHTDMQKPLSPLIHGLKTTYAAPLM